MAMYAGCGEIKYNFHAMVVNLNVNYLCFNKTIKHDHIYRAIR